jgi:hypothetical protein
VGGDEDDQGCEVVAGCEEAKGTAVMRRSPTVCMFMLQCWVFKGSSYVCLYAWRMVKPLTGFGRDGSKRYAYQRLYGVPWLETGNDLTQRPFQRSMQVSYWNSR